MGTRAIYVYLPDEAVDTWKPVEAVVVQLALGSLRPQDRL